MKKIFLLALVPLLIVVFFKKDLLNRSVNKKTAAPIFHKLLNVHEIIIDQKIPIWFVETKDLNVISIGFLFKGAGAVAVPNNQIGLDDLIEEISAEGAGKYDAKAFKEMLLEKNIQLGVSSSLDDFSITVRTTTNNVADAFEVIKLVATQLQINEKNLQRTKDRMLAALEQSLNNPKNLAHDRTNSLLYGENHPYSQTVQEKLRSIPSLTKKQILDFQKQHFTKDKLKIVVCGNISKEKIINYVNDTVKNFPISTSASKERLNLNNLSTRHDIYMNVPQSYINFAQSGLPRNHPDFYAWFLAWRIIGDGNFKGRLFKEIREKKGFAYFIWAAPFSNMLSCGINGATATKSDNVEKVINLIKEELINVQKTGVTQNEFDFAKEQVMGEYALSFDSTARIVKRLMSFIADDLPVSYVNDRNKHFAKLTLNDVNRVIKKYIKPSELLFVVVGNHEKK